MPTLGANMDVRMAIEDASQVIDLNSNESSHYNLPADPKAAPKKFMKPRHDTLSDLWDEWHGLGEYEDIYSGFAGREQVWGSTKGIRAKWRHHMEGNQFTRTKLVIKGIEEYARQKQVLSAEAIAELECHFQSANRGVQEMVSWFQWNDFLPKQKPRGRKKKYDGSGDNGTP